MKSLQLGQIVGQRVRVAVFPFDWRSPGYGSQRQVCDFASLSVHLGGASVMWRGEHESVGDGDVMALNAGEPHQVLDFGRARGLAVAFLPSAVERWPRLLDAVFGPGRFHPPTSERSALVSQLEELGARCRSLESFHEVQGEALLLDVLVRVASGAARPLRSGRSSRGGRSRGSRDDSRSRSHCAMWGPRSTSTQDILRRWSGGTPARASAIGSRSSASRRRARRCGTPTRPSTKLRSPAATATSHTSFAPSSAARA